MASAAMPSVRNMTMAMSASVTPRSFRTTLAHIRSSSPPRGGGQLHRRLLLDEHQPFDQRSWRAARRAAPTYEPQESTGHRLLAAAVPRARPLVHEHLRQIVELNRVAARASTILGRVVQSHNDDPPASTQPV